MVFLRGPRGFPRPFRPNDTLKEALGPHRTADPMGRWHKCIVRYFSVTRA